MPMFNIHKFRFRINNPSINILITTRRTKSTFTSVRDNNIIIGVLTFVHSVTKVNSTTINNFSNFFENNISNFKTRKSI